MDARILKTKQKIKDSLMFLLHSKRIGEISISELCKKASINRNTFYTHYSSPEAVLTDIADELSTELFTMLSKCENPMQIAIKACEHTQINIDVYKMLMQNDAEKVYLKPSIIHSKTMMLYKVHNADGRFSQIQLDMINEFLVNGVIALMKNWIENDCPVSPEFIGGMINLLSKSLIDGLNASK